MSKHSDVLSAERLRELLDYDPDTGVFVWRVDPKSGPRRLGKVAGTPCSKGYIRIRIDRTSMSAHRLAWLYVFGEWPAKEIDHVNGVRNDNRIANLREATRSQNMQNCVKPRSNSTSGCLGVSFHKATKKWMATIRTPSRQLYLGVFDTKEEARAAYLNAKEKHHPFGRAA